MKPVILVVDDDQVLREGLSQFMEREGYLAISASTCAQARLVIEQHPDLVLLDVSLPDGDGFSLCREWREDGLSVPVLFLTAFDQEEQIVKGLDSGGDDYIAKPFRLRELTSRVRARLRRVMNADVYVCGNLRIDLSVAEISTDTKTISLTPIECKLLSPLLCSPGKPVSRETILGRIWDDAGAFVDDNTLTVSISRLREKVGAKHIQTVRGVGYKWTD